MMSSLPRTHFRLLPILALAAALPLGACDDPTDVEEHVEAAGFALMEGTEELIRVFRTDDPPLPTLNLEVGVHEVVFVMLDEDGEPLLHEEEETEEGEEFQVTFGNTSLISWTPDEHARGEEHEFLEFEGELNAVTAGSTSMTVCVLHELHCDFEIEGISVVIQ